LKTQKTTPFFFDLALRKTEWASERTHVVDGAQAVDFLETSAKAENCPDIVFLDLKLPILTGFEVLEWIQAQSFQPPLRVVILSGSDHHADIVRARELGATDYLVKPVSHEELKKRLSDLVPASRLSQPSNEP